jgi:transposase
MAIDTVVQRSAGLDIAKASLVACVRIPGSDGGWRVIKRKFTTMTADLLALKDWLTEYNIARVGMESTSDYWRPVFYLLEQRFDCWLLNARHLRAVPGRKTDMTDAE